MAPRDTGDTFSFNDLAIAGGMTKRAVQHLMDANANSPRSGWLPVGGGIRTLKRVAAIGGFCAAGVPLFPAARLMSALLDYEFNTYDGEIPSGIGPLCRNLPNSALSRVASDDVDNDYWYHRALLGHPDIYVPGAALSSDVFVEIVDRRNVFVGALLGLSTRNHWDDIREQTSFAGQIEGWERDSAATFISASTIAVIDRDDPEFKSTGAALNQMARSAYRNAVGRLTVNLSLAVRNGLDRLARHRGLMPEEVSDAE